jgi:Rieske 2Fe-2S family protein
MLVTATRQDGRLQRLDGTSPKGLPAETYFDPRHYERELQRIWYRNWIYVCRSSELSGRARSALFEVGDQKICCWCATMTGRCEGFHNTCRHRGAAPVPRKEGVMRSGSIVCPYHAWTYNLARRSAAHVLEGASDGFDVADYPLYKVRVREWSGFIFVALTEDPPPFDRLFDCR